VAEGNSKTFNYVTDGYGRYVPPASRFPSATGGAGFKPLADYVHSLGLKFGIHILRGIPRQAVEQNLPIEGSTYHAADAAVPADTCPWNFDNYGIDGNKPAGQAYYDSLARLYASWQIDLIKVDCISSHPYKGDEIRMLRAALDKVNRPIVLSLSPGPAPVEKTDEMRKYAQMWRISDDIWDLWHSNSGGRRPVRQCGEVGRRIRTRTLARCRYAAGWLSRACPRVGKASANQAHTRRAENLAYVMVDLSLASHDRWRFEVQSELRC